MPSSIHVRVDLAGALDAARLALAWRRLPELHPILGCTLARPALYPRWRPGAAGPLELLEKTGFEVVEVLANHDYTGLEKGALAREFRGLTEDDVVTRTAFLMARKRG